MPSIHSVLRFILALGVLLVAVGCAYTGRQQADISLLRDVPPPAQVESILPWFPTGIRMHRYNRQDETDRITADSGDYAYFKPIEIMTADGVHLPTGKPSPDPIRDYVTLIWPEEARGYVSRKAEATLSLYNTRAQADRAFEFAAASLDPKVDSAGGASGDRYVLSNVEQLRSDTWQLLDLYISRAVFQKGSLIIEVHEFSSDRHGRLKEHLFQIIARAINGEKIIPNTWGGR